MIDVAAMRAFVEVVEASSFTHGGKRAGLTRSAAGKAVARLESALGVRLLHRSTRSVGLTADGRLFFERSKAILQSIRDLEDEVTASSAPHGTLRLTAPEAFGRQIVLPILSEFLTMWPDVTAELSLTDKVIDIVADGFDLAIRFGAATGSSDLITRVVARSTGRLCASPSYLSERPPITSLQDLQQNRQLVAGKVGGFHAWSAAEADGSSVPIPTRAALLCDNASALKDAATAGLGVAFLPLFLVAADLKSGALAEVLPGQTSPPIPISIVYPSRKHTAARVRGFIELLTNRLAGTEL